jgi:dipeptidyl aminopeptidase/acylaminoacyl peptidase
MPTDLPTDDAAPWKQRFRAPSIVSMQVAGANPSCGLVATNQRSKEFQLYAWDTSTGALRQLTGHSWGARHGWIAPDGSSIYYLEDQHGDELGHLARVPFAGGAAQDMTPDLPRYTLRGVGMSLSGNMLALNPINADGFQLYVVPLGPDGTPGTPRLVFQSRYETWGAQLSHDGTLAAMYSTERAGGARQYSLLAFDTAGGERVGEVWDGPGTSVEVVRFSPLPGDARILATTTRTGWTRPLLWDARTGARRDLPFDELAGEVLPLDWSADGERLLLCQVEQATQRLYTYDLSTGALVRLRHPDGTFIPYAADGIVSCFGPDGDVWSVWEDSTHPPQVIAIDGRGDRPHRAALTAGTAPTGHPWRSITFSSSDGQTIQGWLGLPDGEGPFPTILEMHGGPHALMPHTFHPWSQAWLDHGFAFLTINFRGSTMLGRAFKEQIWGDIGHWELEDMAAARAWLIEQGIARPDAIFLFGGSYGGFLTLLGLGRQPELWAGGLALAAIADWAANFADASDALKGAFRAWFLGTPAEKPEQYAISSPITYAEQVAAPLLIIQGHSDSRTTAGQMERYVEKLRALGKPVEIDWFDSGHGFAEVEQLVGFQERMLGFALRVLERH